MTIQKSGTACLTYLWPDLTAEETRRGSQIRRSQPISQSLLLFKPGLSPFDPTAVERAFRSCGFTDIRFDKAGGDLDCEYIEPDDWTIIDLSKDASTISTSNTRDAALRDVLLIQKALGVPLRMVDSVYSFDLVFSDIATVEELEAAMENSQTS